MARASREIWRDRVRRWSQSGKSAKAFAAEIDVNVNTLTGWRWRLAREEPSSRLDGRPARGKSRTVEGRQADPVGFLELIAKSSAECAEDRLEVVLESGRVVRVPRRFDAGALRALVAALEAR